MVWVAGQKLYGDRYIIEKKLGEGGSGVAYLAQGKKGNHVVIKTLRDDLLQSPSIDWYREKFIEEALQLSLCRHANIVQIENVFKEGHLPCMVMEYIEGENLQQLVDRQGIVLETEALHYIWQIGAALSAVHDKGLLHRDIKPSNIMVRSVRSEALLIDFGLARGFIPDLTQQLTRGFSNGFAPPEQYYEQARWGDYTDVYALAATLYYLLTQITPTASFTRARGNSLKQPQQINPSISDRVNQAILQGMMLDAAERPRTVQKWLDLLGTGVEPTVQSPPPRARVTINSWGHEAAIYCPNENCQSLNPLTHNFCQQCRTPLPKRYLWAVGDALAAENTGEILADRYLVISKSILFDSKPGLLPQTSELENLQIIKPYLRLIPYRLHVPQVYGVLTLTKGSAKQEVLLLEKPPLNTDNIAKEVHLCSELTTAWGSASSMRQLNWLWQIAQLWQPLAGEGVVSSLLDQELLRVEGPLVRLLELQIDGHSTPELPQLGEFWHQLLPTAKPAIAEFVNAICSSLQQGKIHSSEQLIAILDQGLAEIGQWQTPTIKIATKSDKGPSCQRNEDACYPRSGITITKPPQPKALAIICDGGGHMGGIVASNLAIETIQHEVRYLAKIPSYHIHPATLLKDLEQAAKVANDKINQINDSENRQGRQRMNTTLLMALPIAHEMYVAHVGDSRAYLITRYGCYLVTLDDDIASRKVRSGNAIYRDAVAVQQSGSDSLVQALGMSPSSSLHPTAQRFIFDEDCVFLLCSDGLSDFDRVEQYWGTEILPILTRQLDVANVANKLVEIANTKNGHDNVTIALIHCQVKSSEPKSNLSEALADLSTTSPSNSSDPTVKDINHSPIQKTQVTTTHKQVKGSSANFNWLSWLFVDKKN